MAGTDDYLRALFQQAAAEEAFLDGLSPTQDVRQQGAAPVPASAPALSLMITNRQRAELRKRGVSDEAIRQMTPAEAHARLGLTESSPPQAGDP